MKLSVIILNYNVKHFLKLCLQSVEAAIKTIDAEVIVIDNNSKDGSAELVTANFPFVKWIQNTQNVGFSTANNQAVKEAQGEYLCILNPDTVVPETIFTSLLEFTKTKTNIGIVGCQLIDGKGVFLPESKRNVPKPNVALKKLLGNTETYYANHIQKDEVGKASIFVGAFMFLKRTVYNKVGGFDEQYFMYGEDIDLSYKIEQAGYQNYYYGKETVIHYKGESTLKDKTYAKRFYGAMQIFYKTHFKKHLLFDVLVNVAIKLLPLLPKKEAILATPMNQYVFVSNQLLAKLQIALKHNVLVEKGLTNHQQVEIIFDANYKSFSEIIQSMKTSQTTDNNQFKILSKDHNFILGSNSSLTKGEVISI